MSRICSEGMRDEDIFFPVCIDLYNVVSIKQIHQTLYCMSPLKPKEILLLE